MRVCRSRTATNVFNVSRLGAPKKVYIFPSERYCGYVSELAGATMVRVGGSWLRGGGADGSYLDRRIRKNRKPLRDQEGLVVEAVAEADSCGARACVYGCVGYTVDKRRLVSPLMAATCTALRRGG